MHLVLTISNCLKINYVFEHSNDNDLEPKNNLEQNDLVHNDLKQKQNDRDTRHINCINSQKYGEIQL